MQGLEKQEQAEEDMLFSEAEISSQNNLTPLLTNNMPEIRIGGYAINLLEMHWITATTSRDFHTHRFVEIHVPVCGKGKISTKEKQAFYKSGFFTITQSAQVHSWGATSTPLRMQDWWLAIKAYKDDETPENTDDKIIENLLKADNLVYPLPRFFLENYRMMMEEIKNFQAGSEIILSSLFSQMIIQLSRAIKPAMIPITVRGKRIFYKLDDRIFISRVDEFLQSNLQHNLTLEEIAKHLKMSSRNLTRRYLKIKGQTVWNTLIQFRMNKARNLLRNSSVSIYETAERCGIYNKRYFAVRFKSFFGESPREFRKRCIADKDMNID